MTRKERNVNLDKLVNKLSLKEIDRVRQLVTAEASHCKPMNCSITGCAVLCDGMSCGDFEHSCGVKNLGCVALIKCRGFTGDGDGCGPFEKTVVLPALGS